jgi:hypothetical protein
MFYSNKRFFLKHFIGIINTKDGVNQFISSIRSLTSPCDSFSCLGIDATRITYSCEEPSIAAICGAKDSTNRHYFGGVRQQFSPKGEILLDVIKDIHIGVVEMLRRFYHHNSCLPNKLVFYQIGPDEQSLKEIFNDELRDIRQPYTIVYGHRINNVKNFVGENE